MSAATAEFEAAYRNRTQEHRQHLADTGVTFQAMLRAGDLGVARIAAAGRLYMPAPDGFVVLIMAAWSPVPGSPSRACCAPATSGSSASPRWVGCTRRTPMGSRP